MMRWGDISDIIAVLAVPLLAVLLIGVVLVVFR